MLPENKISQFPITSYLENICKSLKESPSHVLILTAQTAAGKSTVLPLALLEEFKGKMLMSQPRRLAVLGVANRLAELCDEECGKGQIGYKVHLENKIGNNTRLEVVTEGILVRQLQSDPSLEGYNLVIVDEFHERSINTDLLIAFLKEALEFRDDLYIIIMSATMNAQKLQKYFSDDEDKVPLLEIPGRLYPVNVFYEPEKSLEGLVLDSLKRKKTGNILVFLPGISDIRRAYENLYQPLKDDDVEVLILHSSISLEEQKKILRESDKRRVILSSAIAETSLTVPGVNVVIDSGLARVNRMNISTGMENLCTEVESEFSAEQRKGRAGRLEEGICIRMWSEFDPRIKDFPPEILRADITQLVLECAERGVYSFDGIDWLDKPSEAAWTEAGRLLQKLGMLKDDFRISDKGKKSLSLGLHPRLASIALEAYSKGNEAWQNLVIKYSSYAKSSAEIQKRFISDLKARLGTDPYLETDCKNVEKCEGTDPYPLILAGYPDRIAKRLSPLGQQPAEYQFASGRKAILGGQQGTPGANGGYGGQTPYRGQTPQWLVAPSVLAGKVQGIIFDFEELSQAEVEHFMKNHAQKKENCQFKDGKIVKTEDICYGQIVLFSKKIPADSEDLLAAWVNEVKTKGFDSLPLDEKIENFLLRVEFWNQQKGDKELAVPSNLKNKLQDDVEEWLPVFLGTSTHLSAQILYDALYWYLDGSKIDSEVPQILILPNGRKCKVKYERQDQIKPVVEIIIQRIFACFETPQICGKNVLLRLLSPASRPLQVTEDIAGFWSGAWPEICKEMKGRYPKHNWDYRVSDDGEK